MTISHTVRWRDCPSLWTSLMARAVADALPVCAATLGTTTLLVGLPHIPTALTLSCISLALQRAAHAAGSLAIVPAQRAVCDSLRYVLHHTLLRKLAPTLLAEAAPLLRMLERMETQRQFAAEGMFAVDGAERLCLTTPDGVNLDAVVFGRGDPGLPFVVAVLGNGENFEFRADLLGLRTRGFGLLLFNYRGVGASGGAMTTRWGATIDTASAIAYVQSCGVPQHRIIVLGHSIGGAFGVAAACHFPRVCVVSDRSFGRLSTVAQHVLAPWAVSATSTATAASDSARHTPAAAAAQSSRSTSTSRASSWKSSAVRAGVRILLAVCSWELDSAADWRRWSTAALAGPQQQAAHASAAAAAAGAAAHSPPPRGVIISSRWDGVIPVIAQLGHSLLQSGEQNERSPSASASSAPPWCEMLLAPNSNARRGGASSSSSTVSHYDDIAAAIAANLPISSDEHNRGFTPREEDRLCTALLRYMHGETLPPRL